jgi:hypothetical protein
MGFGEDPLSVEGRSDEAARLDSSGMSERVERCMLVDNSKTVALFESVENPFLVHF